MRIQTKTWILDDTNRLNVEEINFLESGHLVVDVLLSSICGTDLHIMAGHDSLSRPLSLGHEFIGSVVSAPNNQYETGDRIIIAPGVPCGECYYCSSFGNGNWCINRKSHGIYGLDSSFPVLGGFSSRIALAHGILLPVLFKQDELVLILLLLFHQSIINLLKRILCVIMKH